MKKLVFAGCSFTAGAGWCESTSLEDKDKLYKNSPHLWTNICHKNINRFKNLEIINVSKSGASNNDIFKQTINAISKYHSEIDTIFCQWTSMPRYNFDVGFELWDTSESFFHKARNHDIALNKRGSWDRKYVNDLLNRLKVMHHLHWEILIVIENLNIILDLVKKLKIKHLFFINGLCPWDKNYFIKLENVLPEAYTEFTKKSIINIDDRDDEDIYKLYHRAHQHYQEKGGINESYWINLYDPFDKKIIDVNFDQNHPGIQSNLIYYELIKEHLKKI
jgi:hypothetical protein